MEILCRNLKCDFSKLIPAFFLNDRSVRLETQLCRIVPMTTNQATASGAMEILPSDSLSMQSMSFGGNRRGMHFINEARSLNMTNSRPQNLDSMESTRNSSMRPNIQYSQSLSTNISQSTSVVNYQNVAMRSGGQEVAQYYPMMNNVPTNFTGSGQPSNQIAQNSMDHTNSAMRPLSTLVYRYIVC